MLRVLWKGQDTQNVLAQEEAKVAICNFATDLFPASTGILIEFVQWYRFLSKRKKKYEALIIIYYIYIIIPIIIHIIIYINNILFVLSNIFLTKEKLQWGTDENKILHLQFWVSSGKEEIFHIFVSGCMLLKFLGPLLARLFLGQENIGHTWQDDFWPYSFMSEDEGSTQISQKPILLTRQPAGTYAGTWLWTSETQLTKLSFLFGGVSQSVTATPMTPDKRGGWSGMSTAALYFRYFFLHSWQKQIMTWTCG